MNPHGKTPAPSEPAGPVSPAADQCGPGEPAVLATRPEKAAFAFRYFLAITPCILVLVSILIRSLAEAALSSFSSSVGSTLESATGMYGSMTTYLPGSVSSLNAMLSDGTAITVLLIAPVGIFLIAAAVGWTLRVAEVWTGTSLALGLSCLLAFILVIMGGGTAGRNQFLLFLEWTAFFIQPFSILATVVVLVWLDRFRRSIRYTITSSGIYLCGGVWKKQEHLIPHAQVGRVVLEQDFLGARYNYGTVIPVSITRWGAETSIRGIGAAGQKDNVAGGILFARGREEASRSPIDCLFGIRDPKNAQRILTGFMARQEKREEEQVAYLKKIYENRAAYPVPDESGAGEAFQGKTVPVPATHDRETGDPAHQSAITRVTDPDDLLPEAPVRDGTIREIPPVKNPASSPARPAVPPESVPDQIRKLAELRDAGILTDEEFSEKKTELLKRM